MFWTDMSKGIEYPDVMGYPLPNVTEDCGDSLTADIHELGYYAVMDKALGQLTSNNSELFKAIEKFSTIYETQAERDAVYETMLVTHELLRRQGEAQQMDALLEAPGDPF